jgi:hypothetical protein
VEQETGIGVGGEGVALGCDAGARVEQGVKITRMTHPLRGHVSVAMAVVQRTRRAVKE